MRFITLVSAAFAVSTVYATALPRNVNEVAAAVQDQITFNFKDDDDPCPDLKVLCIKKDSDGNEEVVGDVCSCS